MEFLNEIEKLGWMCTYKNNISAEYLKTIPDEEEKNSTIFRLVTELETQTISISRIFPDYLHKIETNCENIEKFIEIEKILNISTCKTKIILSTQD